MKAYSKSDAGLVRKTNQDDCRTGMFDKNTAWAVVCDGMGGMQGGSTASKTAVDKISSYLKSHYKKNFSSEDIKNMLVEAAAEANNGVYEMSVNDKELSGMGTTLVLALAKNDRLYIIHAGDSRAYLIMDGELIQLTKDHSVVQEMVNAGELTPEEARIHPNRNLITRALGVEPQIQLDYTTSDFPENSMLLICTDGLSNYLMPGDLVSLAEKHKGDDLTEQLISTANNRGGGDNITVVTINR